MDDYAGHCVVAPCGDTIEVSSLMFDAVCIRCPRCGDVTTRAALLNALNSQLLQRIGAAGHESQELAKLEPRDQPWMEPMVATAARHLNDYGLILCRGAFPTDCAEMVRREAERALEAALSLPSEQASDTLTSVRDPINRHDVRLSATDAVLSLLETLIAEGTPVGACIEQALGLRACLCECSCIISAPGAPAQAVHCDTAASAPMEIEEPDATSGCVSTRLLTIFSALGDIGPDMGPTRMWPTTHTPRFHEEMSERGPLLFNGRESVAMTLRQGDCAVMDSRLWHCGGANVSTAGRRRFLLVTTFGITGNLPEGSTYSMLTHLEGRYTLKSLREGGHGRRLEPGA